EVGAALAPRFVPRRLHLVGAGFAELRGCAVGVVGVQAELEVTPLVLRPPPRDGDPERVELEERERRLALARPAVRHLEAERLRVEADRPLNVADVQDRERLAERRARAHRKRLLALTRHRRASKSLVASTAEGGG